MSIIELKDWFAFVHNTVQIAWLSTQLLHKYRKGLMLTDLYNLNIHICWVDSDHILTPTMLIKILNDNGHIQ